MSIGLPDGVEGIPAGSSSDHSCPGFLRSSTESVQVGLIESPAPAANDLRLPYSLIFRSLNTRATIDPASRTNATRYLE